MSYILYVVGATIVALWLSFKTDRRLLSFILIFWLFTQPVLNTALKISFSWLPFDLQPNRLLLFALLPYLLFAAMTSSVNARATVAKRPPFEKYMYVYLVFVTLSLALNFGAIRKQNMVAIPAEIITFIVVYFTTRMYMTKAVFESIQRAIVYLGVVAAFVAIYQIAVDPMFLKTCDPRFAYGTVVRASAMFQAEYELGYFQILAAMIVMVRYRGSWLRYFLVPLLAFSVVLTFHRLDLIILLVCLAIYLMIFGKTANKVGALVGIMFATALLSAAFLTMQYSGDKNEGIASRLEEDTVSGRLAQYWVVFQALPKYPFGMGDYENKAYYDLMAENRMMRSVESGTEKWHRVPYQVHNGYLQTGIMHGIFAMLAFIALLASMLWYFKRRITSEFRYSAIPFFAVLIWILSNISNGVSYFGIYFAILLAILSGTLVAFYRSGSTETMQRVSAGAAPNGVGRRYVMGRAARSK